MDSERFEELLRSSVVQDELREALEEIRVVRERIEIASAYTTVIERLAYQVLHRCARANYEGVMPDTARTIWKEARAAYEGSEIGRLDAIDNELRSRLFGVKDLLKTLKMAVSVDQHKGKAFVGLTEKLDELVDEALRVF